MHQSTHHGSTRTRVVCFLFLVCGAGVLFFAFNIRLKASGATTLYLPLLSSGSAPCSEVQHDPTKWHSLIDPTGCHYDHEHKHNPDEVAHIFGPAGAWFGGTSLSYPWQTNNENLTKHEAYSWIVRHDIPANGRDVWIKDFRWLVHADGYPFTAPDGTLHGGYLGRFHSYSLEAQVCNTAGQCGLVRTGGWIDFGHLELDGIDDCVDLPTDPSQQETCNNLGRRRIHFYWPGDGVPGHSSFFWYGRAGSLNGDVPALHPVQVAVSTGDNNVNLVPNDLYTLHFFCPNWDCELNSSTIQAHVVGFAVNSAFDPDGNGLADFSGYTDRYGVLVTGCTAPSLDCVPLIIEHAPVGQVQHRDDQDLGLPTAGEQDFDISPPEQWWIKYPETPILNAGSFSPQEISQLYACVVPDTTSEAKTSATRTVANSIWLDDWSQGFSGELVAQLIGMHPDVGK